jgi:hypothetical protein
MTPEEKVQTTNTSQNQKPHPDHVRTLLALISVLGASLGLSSPAWAQNQKQQMERWKILQDTQTKIFEKKQTSGSHGSTGPTSPLKPTAGNLVAPKLGGSTGPTVPPTPGGSRK